MDARDFLSLAQLLLATEKTPRGFRTVIGRAYYAAFNVASDFLSNLGFKLPKDGTAHSLAYKLIYNCKDIYLKTSATNLNNLKGVRTTADYDLDDESVEKEPVANSWTHIANEIIQTLDSCKGDFARLGNIKIEIKNYMTDTRLALS